MGQSAYSIAMKEMGELIEKANLGQVAFDKAIEPIMEQLGDANRVVDLFAMSGQSNMQGQSESAPVPFEIKQYRAYEYKLLTNTLTTVKHPFGEDIGDLLLGAYNGWGSLSPKFAESLFNTTGVAPLMVGVAKGATVIFEWIGNARYAKVVEKVNAAVTCATANNLIVRNKYFVWLQGESDGISAVTKQDYKQRFLTLWNDLKRDCGFTKCLIIRVAKFYAYDVVPIIKAQEELARENEDVVMLTRITGTFSEGNGLLQSNFHYTNAGYNLAGSTAGRQAGNYINHGNRPTLESEPYPEAENATKGKYEFKFRSGSLTEATGKISTTAIGAPVVNPAYVELNGASGIRLGKDMILDGDATISVTGLFSAPVSVGAVFTSYNGNVNSDFVFYYLLQSTINLANSVGQTAKFTETQTIVPELSKYNHYVIQKIGRIYSLYFNDKLLQTIFNGPQIINLNNLFFGDSNLGYKGRLKHCLIDIGGVTTPREADPLFYSNAEQGTA